MKMSVARVLNALVFPIFGLVMYWRELDGDYGAGQMVVAGAIALVLSIGIYVYPPIAKRIESKSVAWLLGLGLTVIIVLVGATNSLTNPENTWGMPVAFFAIWIPVIHVVSRSLDT